MQYFVSLKPEVYLSHVVGVILNQESVRVEVDEVVEEIPLLVWEEPLVLPLELILSVSVSSIGEIKNRKGDVRGEDLVLTNVTTFEILVVSIVVDASDDEIYILRVLLGRLSVRLAVWVTVLFVVLLVCALDDLKDKESVVLLVDTTVPSTVHLDDVRGVINADQLVVFESFPVLLLILILLKVSGVTGSGMNDGLSLRLITIFVILSLVVVSNDEQVLLEVIVIWDPITSLFDRVDCGRQVVNVDFTGIVVKSSLQSCHVGIVEAKHDQTLLHGDPEDV